MIVLVPYYATVLTPWQHRTFNVPLFVPLLYFIRGRFANFSTRRNKSLHTQGHLSFTGKNSLLYCCLISSISLSVCLKLTIWNVIDVLARSSISHSLRSLFAILQLSHCSICLLLFLFCCFLALWLLPYRRYCFSCLVCCAVLRFSLPFLILAPFIYHAIFIAAVHFIAVQPAISRLFIQGWTLSCRFFSLDLSSPYSLCC